VTGDRTTHFRVAIDTSNQELGASDTQVRPFDWQRRAACRTLPTKLFFATGTSDIARWDQERAKAVCKTCPVRNDCLEFALETGEAFGVWGGLNADERGVLKKAANEQG
jgi:WhiB family redox-sensing transcriptional regulator